LDKKKIESQSLNEKELRPVSIKMVENSDIEIGNSASNPLMLNHLK